MDNAQVEAVARAMYEADEPFHSVFPWPDLNEIGRADGYRLIAKAAITAIGPSEYERGFQAAKEAAGEIASKWRDENKAAAAKARKRDARLNAVGFDGAGMADLLEGAAIECDAIATAISNMEPGK